MSVVLALQLPQAILLAADSRVSVLSQGQHVPLHDDASKILACNQHAFAAAGEGIMLDDRVDAFQLARTLMEASRRSSAIDLADEFVDVIAPCLLETMNRAWKPTDDREGVLPGLQFLFSNAAEGHPALAWRTLVGVGSASTGIRRIEVAQELEWPGPSTLIFLGQQVDPKQCKNLRFRTVAQAPALHAWAAG